MLLFQDGFRHLSLLEQQNGGTATVDRNQPKVFSSGRDFKGYQTQIDQCFHLKISFGCAKIKLTKRSCCVRGESASFEPTP